MRWVNLRDGIKQRINEILGKGISNSTPASNTPTDWSVQSAMLENLRRIVKALVGDSESYGRVMRGCVITIDSGKNINISSGLALTRNGNIVVFGGASSFDLSAYNGQTVSIAIKHENLEIPGDTGEAFPNVGKNSGLIGRSGTVELVNDDSGVNVSGNDLVVVDESTADNHCYLGLVTVPDPGDITSDDIVNTDMRGLGNIFYTPNLSVTNNSELNNLEVSGTTTLQGFNSVNGDMTVSDSKTFTLPAGTDKVKVGSEKTGVTESSGISGIQSIEIKNGIVVGITLVPS